MAGGNTGQNIRRNVRASIAAYGWGMSIHMLRMPILFSFLTVSEYGMWLAAWSVTILFTIQNFGLSTTLINYTAHHHPRGEYEILNERLNTGLFFTLLLMATVFSVFYYGIDYVVAFLELDSEEFADTARIVLLGVGVSTVISVTTQSLDAVVVGLQRLDIRDLSRTAIHTIEFIVMVVLLSSGYGIRGVVWANIGREVAYLVFVLWLIPRLTPHVKFNPFAFRKRQVRELFLYGGKMQMLGFAALFWGVLSTFLLTRVLGPVFVAMNGSANRVAESAHNGARVAFGSLVPASATLLATDQRDTLLRVYNTALRLTAVGVAWILTYLAVFSDVLMRMFLGDKFHVLAAMALTILVPATYCHALTGTGSSLLRGAGRPRLELMYMTIAIAGFVVLLAPNLLGYVQIDKPMMESELSWAEHGIYVLYWPSVVALSSMLFVVLANRSFGVRWYAPFDQVLLPALAAPVLGLAIRWVWLQTGIGSAEKRWEALAAVLVTGPVYVLAGALAIWFLPGLKHDDKMQILRVVPGGVRIYERFSSKS